MLKKLLALFVVFSIVSFTGICSFKVKAASKVEEARKGVVMIYCHGEEQDEMGSGFVVGKAGGPARYVVTNYHVIAGNPEAVAVVVSSDVLIKADPVYVNPDADYAILKLEKDLQNRIPLPLLKSSSVSVAQKVYALGFPGAASQIEDKNTWEPDDVTVSSGIISKMITVDGVPTYQIDASINPGNSGGPLITEDGAVIGIDRFKSVDATNINGAIEIDEIIPTLDSLNIPYEFYTAQPSDKSNPANSNSISSGNKTSLTNMLSNKWFIIIIGAVFLVLIVVVIILMTRRPQGSQNSPQVQEDRTAQQLSPSPASVPMPAPTPVSSPPVYSQDKRLAIYGVSGIYENKVFSLGSGKLTIGRDFRVCNVVYPKDTEGISGIHCEVSIDTLTNKCILVDLGSSYGTFLASGEKLISGRQYFLNVNDGFYLASKLNKFEIREI